VAPSLGAGLKTRRYTARSAADVEEVVEYIAQQEIHHRVASFQEEFRKLLDAHGIAYDERYVWE
jgi:putative transposase